MMRHDVYTKKRKRKITNYLLGKGRGGRHKHLIMLICAPERARCDMGTNHIVWPGIGMPRTSLLSNSPHRNLTRGALHQ